MRETTCSCCSQIVRHTAISSKPLSNSQVTLLCSLSRVSAWLTVESACCTSAGSRDILGLLTTQEPMREQAAPSGRQPNQHSGCGSLAPTAHPGHALAAGTPSPRRRACADPSHRRSATTPLLGPVLTAPPPPPASASSPAPHPTLSAACSRRSPTESRVATLSFLCSTPLTAPQSVDKSDCLL